MVNTVPHAVAENFLGQAPVWYKWILLLFLIINPLLFFFVNPFLAGWLLVAEFIFTLAMALKCYPLMPGGLLALQAIVIGMTTPEQVSLQLAHNQQVLLLLIFMVAGIYFMKQLLLFIFTRLLLSIRCQHWLGLTFCLASAALSAFLDALTVVAVVITISTGFYSVYHKVRSENETALSSDDHRDTPIESAVTAAQFRAFLRSLMMQAGIGTSLGGVMTMVGEPQNLIIAQAADWSFADFFLHMSPVTLPVLVCGILTSLLVERFRLFGYGETLPPAVREILLIWHHQSAENRTRNQLISLWVQALTGIWLIIALAFHVAEVGLVGLSVIILASTFCGITEEQAIGKAFTEALPFTALLTVFFAIIAVIVEQKLFSPLIGYVFQAEPSSQAGLFYLFNGLLSAISDNVFVGSVYINEAKNALNHGMITHQQFERLAVATNAGTNLPSVATPNGQAAFLFLMTSALAPLIRLSYGRMVWMAFPFTVVLSLAGYLSLVFILEPVTAWFVQQGWKEALLY